MNVVLGICRIEGPIFAVFAVQPMGPMGFCGISTGVKELMVDGLLANIGSGIVPFFCSSSLAKEVPVTIVRGTNSVSLGVVCATP